MDSQHENLTDIPAVNVNVNNASNGNLTEDFPKNIQIKKELDVSIEQKCGEIYFANDIFHLNCNFCATKFNSIKIFARHFIQDHLTLNVDQTIIALKTILSDDENCEDGSERNIKLFDVNVDIDEINEETKCDENNLLAEEDIKEETDFFNKSSNQEIEESSFCKKINEERRRSIQLNISEINLEENIAAHSSEDSNDSKSKKKWVCSVCKQPFTRRDNMLRHKWKIHKEKPNPDYGEIRLDCKWCGQHFKRQSDRSRHENQQHEADGTKISRRRNYKENPLERHVCETCGNSYKHGWSLQEHIRIHTGERPYKCTLCPSTFAKRQNFVVHQKYHSGEKRYKCQYCNKGFVQKTKLILHEMVHTGTYNAQCNICGKQYRCGSHLNVHMKKHLYDKCHKCEICEKRFYTADSLKRHSALHLDKKPFHCDICSAEYATKCSLRKHVKRRHKTSEEEILNKPIAETETATTT